MDIDLEVPALAEDVFSEITLGSRFGECALDDLRLLDVFASDKNVAYVHLAGIRGDDQPLDQLMWVAIDEDTILERSGLISSRLQT